MITGGAGGASVGRWPAHAGEEDGAGVLRGRGHHGRGGRPQVPLPGESVQCEEKIRRFKS